MGVPDGVIPEGTGGPDGIGGAGDGIGVVIAAGAGATPGAGVPHFSQNFWLL